MKNFMIITFFIISAKVYADCETIYGEVNLNPERYTNSAGTKLNRAIETEGNYETSSCDDDPVDLPPIVVTGYTIPGPYYYWMGSARFFHITHAGSGGGTPANNVSQAKYRYCKAKDKVMALLSAMPVSGSVLAGYGVAVSSQRAAQATYDYALQDIERYIQMGLHVPPPPLTIIDWYSASINWNDFDIWTGNPTLNPENQTPEVENGGALQIFAHFLNTLGQGNGTSNYNQSILDEMIGEDPQPDVPC